MENELKGKFELLEMIELLVAALDEAEQALADGGVYDQRPYGWLGDNGLRARAIAILACDKVINGILADINDLPDAEIIENTKQDQHFKNRKLLEIKDLLIP